MTQPPTIAVNGARVLQESLGLFDGPAGSWGLGNVVLVAIDFENIPNLKEENVSLNLDSQAGLATFDTQALDSLQPYSAIQTHNSSTGSSSYCAKASRKFLFGKSLTIGRKDMPTDINSIIPHSRNVVLVGHDVRHELHALRLLNFKFPASIVSIIDTSKIARELNVTASSLFDLLQVLQCPFDKLHCAGNDAHFTLRVSLLLAVRAYIKEHGTQHSSRVALLEEMAYSPISYRVDPHVKAANKKAKRLQRSRKFQSRFWDAELQEKIRAERAEKRLAIRSPQGRS